MSLGIFKAELSIGDVGQLSEANDSVSDSESSEMPTGASVSRGAANGSDELSVAKPYDGDVGQLSEANDSVSDSESSEMPTGAKPIMQPRNLKGQRNFLTQPLQTLFCITQSLLFSTLFCLDINVYFIFFFLSRSPIKKERNGSKKRKKNGSACFLSVGGTLNSIPLSRQLANAQCVSRCWSGCVEHSQKHYNDELGRKSPRNKTMTSEGHFIKCASKVPQNFIPGFFSSLGLNAKKSLAFSLIEIMVGIIVISMLVAAFAPVITKKVSSTATTLSSALGLGIDSRIFLYNESKNKIDGCKLSYDKTYLQCPFKVPEGVSSINVVISGAGGGGAGAMANIENKTSATSFTINDKVKNIKIPYLVSAGGNGGYGKTTTSTHTKTETIRPKSQSDCDKLGTDLYYVSGASACITMHNLSEKNMHESFQADIKSLKSATNYNDKKHEFGDKICWSTAANIGFKEQVFKNTYSTYQDYYKTNVSNDPDFPVCTYPAAKYICDKYGYGTAYDGKWRLPNSTEAAWVASKYPNNISAFARTGGDKGDNNVLKGRVCDPGYSANSLKVNQYRYQDKGAGSSSSNIVSPNPNNLDRFRNVCLPEYVWGQNGKYYLLKPKASQYTYVTTAAWNGGRYIANIYSVRATFDDCVEIGRNGDGYFSCGSGCTITSNALKHINSGHGCLEFITKDYAPFSVRCVIDWMEEKTQTSTSTVTKIGGGGASGAAITDIVIPNTLLSDWQGAVVTVTKGTKSSYAAYGGGSSSIEITKNGQIKFALTIEGGGGGSSAGSYSHGSGGSPTKKFTYIINGSSKTSSEYSYQQPITLSNGVTFTFTPGNAGLGGSYGGVGGTSPASANIGAGGGGQGGAAAGSFSSGQDGYAIVNYQNIYKGAAGGGGSGSGFTRIENIPVKEGKIVTVKVGRGGIGGAANTNGGVGGKTSLSYDGKTIAIDGGNGGSIGTGATADNPNYIPDHGSGGSAVSYTIPSSFKSLTILEQKGLAGNEGAAIKEGSNLIAASGGMGGSSGINEWSLANSIPVSELSFGCGGMLTFADYACYNDEVNGSFSQSDFSNPGKVYKTNNTEYGSAGSGGGGGGINYNTGDIGKGSNGQNGYIMLWWDSN